MRRVPLGEALWEFHPESWRAEDAVGVGADLEPATIVEAYRVGAFPMPDAEQVIWWSPMKRGVLRPEELRVSKSLRRSCKRYRVTINESFTEVIHACGDPSRPGSWIDARIRRAYIRLHELGWAHSFETRTEDGTLVGGLYGLSIGGLFAGESMFHRATDASKAALVVLAETMAGGLIDTQWSTPHLASLGVREWNRDDYLRELESILRLPPPEILS